MVTLWFLSISFLFATEKPISTDPCKLIAEIAGLYSKIKPGSRGKAYMAWVNRAQWLPPAVFDWGVMDEAQRKDALVTVGGFYIGKKEVLKIRPEPDKSLNSKQKAQLEKFESNDTSILKTKVEELKEFEKRVDAYFGKNPEELLARLKVSLEFTPEKQKALAEGRADGGGYFMVESNGHVIYLSFKEVAILQKKLGLEDVKHGELGVLLSRLTGQTEFKILDYGKVYVNAPPQPLYGIRSIQDNWNDGHEFNTLQFLLGF